MSKKINVITLGCSKNLVDSEHLMAQLDEAGYEIVTDSNFFVLFFGLEGVMGNNALWLAYIGFIVIRFVLMLVATKGVNVDLLMDNSKN